MDAVTCVTWVNRGVAKRRPDKVKLTEDDLSQLVKRLNETNFSENSQGPDDESVKISEDSRKRKRVYQEKPTHEEDDDWTDEDEDTPNPLSLSGVAVFSSGEKDPYLKDTVDSEEEDEEILPDDNLVVVGKMKSDFCNLEVYVYDEKGGNTWCHHEIILPNIPLCMDVINHDMGDGSPGNFIALGTMGPDIEIWDLDIMETLEPSYILHGKSKVKGKNKKKKTSHNGHSDAVLSLAWNRNLTHILASGSADCTLGLWDLDEAKISTLVPHPDKVQTVQWHPSKPSILLTGCADRSINMFDCKDLKPSKTSWQVGGEVENVLWNIHNDDQFFACTDTGLVYLFDVRSSKPMFQLHAHSKDVTGMSLSSSIKGCLLTTSADGSIKVWDVRSNPKHVSTKELPLGQLFCCASCPDAGHVFAVGGECELKVMNLKRFSGVVKYFELSNVETQQLSEDFELLNPGDDAEDNSDLSDVDISVSFKKKKEKRPSGEGNAALENGQATGGVAKKKKKKRGKRKKKTFTIDTEDTQATAELD